ncbi:MAG: ATP-binding protein [Bacteroidetes bacterium]|nr:ATP-binding protein [Bacteroidota bacterium]
MRHKVPDFFLLFFLLTGLTGICQNQHKIDSLQTELKKFEIRKKGAGSRASSIQDSLKVLLLAEISNCYFIGKIPDKSMEYAQQCEDLSEKIGYKKGLWKARLRIGAIYGMNHDFKQAMDAYRKALPAALETGDKEAAGKIYTNMAIACNTQGNFTDAKNNGLMAVKMFLAAGNKPFAAEAYMNLGNAYACLSMASDALKCFLYSLDIFKEMGNQARAAMAYNNLAIVYTGEKQYAEALRYYLLSKEISAATNDSAGLAWSYRSIGANYNEERNYPEALKNLFSALKIHEKTGDKDGIAREKSIIGDIYSKIGNYSMALRYLKEALTQFQETGSKSMMAYAEHSIGVVLKKQGDFDNALKHITRGLELSREIDYTMIMDEGYKNLAEIHAHLQNYKAAYENEVLFNKFHDSIYNSETTKKLTGLQMKFDFDKQHQADSLQHAHENKINLLNLKKQKTYTGLGIAGIVLVMLLLFFVFRNFKNQRKATEQMAIARQRAEQSERFKHQFLANMSHEIRTPMNAVMGMTNLVLDSPLNAKQRFYLEGVRKSGETLLHIINDILDLSKIEAGKMDLEKIHFSVSDLLDQVKQTLQHKAEEKGVQLITGIDAEVCDVLMGDPVRLNQVLINLTGNAIKFTEKGSVTIKVEKGVLESSIKFSIIDTGIGIPQDKLQTVFDSFTQANSSDTRKFGGTGLGLSISKQLVELMDGKIAIESREGYGSVFSFEIHCPEGKAELLMEQTSAEEIDGTILDGLKILLADDNEYNRIVTNDTLRSKAKVEITEATNGLEVVDLLNNQDFDVVLMDVQMPMMDGYEATRQIRGKFTSPKNQIQIIALTASVIRSDLDKCREAGMNDYVPKPFNTAHLIAVIAKATGREIRFSGAKIPAGISETGQKISNTDLSYLKQFCDGDKVRMQKYIDIFLASVPAFISKMQLASDAGDFREIASQMHGYRTKLLMMGMNDAKDLAEEIELQCAQQGNPDLVILKVQKVIQQVQTADQELRGHSFL